MEPGREDSYTHWIAQLLCLWQYSDLFWSFN
jgi:hypothetical protein